MNDQILYAGLSNSTLKPALQTQRELAEIVSATVGTAWLKGYFDISWNYDLRNMSRECAA